MEESRHHERHIPRTPAERERRKNAQREAKTLKKARREQQRIDNRRRLDHRPHVRMSAMLEMERMTANSNNNSTTTPTQYSTDTKKTPLVLEGNDDILVANRVVSLIDVALSTFALPIVVLYPPRSVLELDLSHNCLSELPGLEALQNLEALNIRRNKFRVLPSSLITLSKLSRLNASRNQLRNSADLLVTLTQPPLPSLVLLDLTFNKKLFTQSFFDLLQQTLPTVTIAMTITSPPPTGSYIGASPGHRHPELLRSQLEPYTTLQLRQRLIDTFAYRPYNTYAAGPPESRATVMATLLHEYATQLGSQTRTLRRSFGSVVPPAVMHGVRQELDAWSARFDGHERPMIAAAQYMILRSPTEVEDKITRLGSRRAQAAKKKFQQNLALWNVAKAAMATVDPDFAEAFTGLAVTRNFRGSPHIDTTNSGPFYGLSTGTFADGTGGIRVELDPLTICEVNTKDRLGRVDGRFPHWVGPYDPETIRYSLIFYVTEGVVQPKGKAVFGDIFEDNKYVNDHDSKESIEQVVT